METYCGKQCEYCVDKVDLNCPGCKAVPGGERQKDCEIAACCRSKEYENCARCSMSVGCGRQLGRNRVPELRRKKAAEAAEHRAELARRAPFLARWLIVLFWLSVPCMAAALLTNDCVVESFPVLRLPGLLLQGVSSAAYGVILLKLSVKEKSWRVSGVLFLLLAVLSLAAIPLPFSNVGLMVVSAVILLGTVLLGEYYEYRGHNRIMLIEDEAQARQWVQLWKLSVTVRAGAAAGMVILVVAPLLGLLLSLAALVGIVVVEVRKLCTLRLMIIHFREYPVSD